MADQFLITALELYVIKPTVEMVATTIGSGGAEKRNRKSGKSTSKKIQSSNDDDSESKNSKPKPKPNPKPTSRTALALDSDSAFGLVLLPAPTPYTTSDKGLSPTTTRTTSMIADAAATTSKILFYVSFRFTAAVPPSSPPRT